MWPDAVDFSTFFDGTGRGDLDENFAPIPWERSRAELVARRWTTVPGEMDDPTFGYPIQRYYNAGMLAVEVLALQAGLRQEALKVEGVEDADVTVTRDPATGVVSVSGSLVVLGTDGVSASTWRYVFRLSAGTLALITLIGPGD